MTPDEVRCDRCEKVGEHLCAPRAARVVRFFHEILTHTKGTWARRPFILDPWQREIIVPVFGTVEWSEEFEQWIRRYDLAWIEVARKNGKSELLAGCALVLLCADDEEGAEVYSAAMDREQARKVYDVAERMVELSPVLSQRIHPYVQSKTLVYERLASKYQVLSADAKGNLGHNPSGVVFDEVLTQPDADLWTALRTATGARAQQLTIAATTAGDDQASFAWREHEYSERAAQDPDYDRRRFAFIRNMPMDADPFDEANWEYPNPALDSFKSRSKMRDAAAEAKNDPVKETSFRQFQGNQWVAAASRAIPLAWWESCVGPAGKAATPEELDDRAIRQKCWGGLDLSAKYDLTSLCWLFPALHLALWRFWLPMDTIEALSKLTGGAVGEWAKAGWITGTPGSTIDYDEVYAQVDRDREKYQVQDINYDPNMAAPIIREFDKRGLTSVQVSQGFALSEPIKEMLRQLKAGELVHGDNPVARWNSQCFETKQDRFERLYPMKPIRGQTGKRIDGMVALVLAIDGVMRRGDAQPEDWSVVGF